MSNLGLVVATTYDEDGEPSFSVHDSQGGRIHLEYTTAVHELYTLLGQTLKDHQYEVHYLDDDKEDRLLLGEPHKKEAKRRKL